MARKKSYKKLSISSCDVPNIIPHPGAVMLPVIAIGLISSHAWPDPYRTVILLIIFPLINQTHSGETIKRGGILYSLEMIFDSAFISQQRLA